MDDTQVIEAVAATQPGEEDDRPEVSEVVFYIAGPMTGLPDYNFPLFNEVAGKLRAAGYGVNNPAENLDGDTSHPRELYMAMDVFHVLNSNALVLLPGWQKSRGATLEAYLAQELGLPLFYYRPNEETGTIIEPNRVDPGAAMLAFLTKGKAAKRKLRGAPQVKMARTPVSTRNGELIVPGMNTMHPEESAALAAVMDRVEAEHAEGERVIREMSA